MASSSPASSSSPFSVALFCERLQQQAATLAVPFGQTGGTTKQQQQQHDPLSPSLCIPQHHQALKRQGRAASILVLISSDGYVLLTKRSMRLRSHPGEVALPGGKQDPEDCGDDIVTALRETYEEVGLDYRQSWSSSLTVLESSKNSNTDTGKDGSILYVVGRILPTIESFHHLCVTPIVAIHPTRTWQQLDGLLKLNDDEVEAAFWTPLEYFVKGVPTELYSVPWSQDVFCYRHYDFVYQNKNKGHQQQSEQTFAITGLTAHVVHQLASIVYPPTTSSITRSSSLSPAQYPPIRNEFHGYLQRRFKQMPTRSRLTTRQKRRRRQNEEIQATHTIFSWKEYYYVLVPGHQHPNRNAGDNVPTTVTTRHAVQLYQYNSFQQAQKSSSKRRQPCITKESDTSNPKNCLFLSSQSTIGIKQMTKTKEQQQPTGNDDGGRNNSSELRYCFEILPLTLNNSFDITDKDDDDEADCGENDNGTNNDEGDAGWVLAAESEWERNIWIKWLQQQLENNTVNLCSIQSTQ